MMMIFIILYQLTNHQPPTILYQMTTFIILYQIPRIVLTPSTMNTLMMMIFIILYQLTNHVLL